MNTPLKIERTKRKLTGEALAREIGVSQSYIARLENGTQRASPDTACRIAKYLENAVTRDQILFPEDYVTADLPPKKTPTPRLQRAS